MGQTKFDAPLPTPGMQTKFDAPLPTPGMEFFVPDTLAWDPMEASQEVSIQKTTNKTKTKTKTTTTSKTKKSKSLTRTHHYDTRFNDQCDHCAWLNSIKAC